jgi:Spy/CpxP family protein refolding chaperone
MLKRMLMGVLVVVWGFSPAMAQEREAPGGKWWHIPRVADELKLTEAEKRTLDACFVESRRKLIDLKSALERERFELDNLLDRDTMDEGAVMAQFGRLEKARTDLARERFRFLLDVRKTIGSERFRELKMRFQNFRKERSKRLRGRLKEEYDAGRGSSSGDPAGEETKTGRGME